MLFPFKKYERVWSEIQNSWHPFVNLNFAHKDQQPLLLQNKQLNFHSNTSKLEEALRHELINRNLNSSQIKAVVEMLKMKQLSIIHGP